MSTKSRKAQAAKIIESPQLYKVCEGCESIVLEKTVLCPNCNGYRFDDSRDRVIEQATILGSRPPKSVMHEDWE